MLVLDASAALPASAAEDGFRAFGNEELVAPPLLWPEVRSVLHVSAWRGLIDRAAAERSLAALESGHVRERQHRRLGEQAWQIADELGWAKTYDAEYLALAALLDVPVLTFDRRLRNAADRIGVAVRTNP